jgi:hypothetical protein
MQIKSQHIIPDDVMNVISSMLSEATESDPCKQVALRIAAFAYSAGINAGLHSALEQLEETHSFIQTLTEQREEKVS